ncbi:hypothetical protein A2U01_0027776 [Trifolium medium]|uniref:Uncharacterized protein n=1 Tax=Trifolium medium TaxID=97028 RepID=A0A392P648_9FABA|nr:hypothetical protein [Trifolium medium]
MCVRIRDTIQKAIEEGRLIFEDKPKMKVDENHFHVAANYAELEYDVNVVEAAITNMAREEYVVEAVFSEVETVNHVIEKKSCYVQDAVPYIFDKAAAKAFERSDIKKNYDISEAKKEVANEEGPWKNQHGKKNTKFFDKKKKRPYQKKREYGEVVIKKEKPILLPTTFLSGSGLLATESFATGNC